MKELPFWNAPRAHRNLNEVHTSLKTECYKSGDGKRKLI